MRIARTATIAVTFLLALASTATAQDKPAPAAPPTAPAKAPAVAAMEYCVFRTSMGDIVMELDRAKAPITVENFVGYIKDGFYDGTVFHRIVPNFVIQGGGFDTTGTQKPNKAPISNEWQNGLKNLRGTLSMARTANPNSATSQFFISLKDNDMLDQPISGGAGYAVYGKVIAGMDIVDQIATVKR
ncbi:MAG: peptidylprolyl isomerase, partial [Phycisphaerales bacterium]